MKAISIRQPWAYLIISGVKDLENRNWYCHYRGELYIHTGKIFDLDGYQYIINEMKIDIPHRHSNTYYLGGIIGKVNMIDCVRSHKSKWFFGRYGFLFVNPEKINFIPLKGQLGIFNYE